MAVEATEKCSLLREVPEVSRLRRRRCPHRVPRWPLHDVRSVLPLL